MGRWGVVVLAAVALAGCGGGSDRADPPTTAAPATVAETPEESCTTRLSGVLDGAMALSADRTGGGYQDGWAGYTAEQVGTGPELTAIVKAMTEVGPMWQEDPNRERNVARAYRIVEDYCAATYG